jgi:hypothetical protein
VPCITAAAAAAAAALGISVGYAMQVRYLRQKYPAVRVSLHAGEMTPDLVDPKDLTHHVKDSVTVAMAHRYAPLVTVTSTS